MSLCARVRGDFPELRRGLVYLDSAASTLKPVQVVEAMRTFALERYSNVHRGSYRLAAEATRAYEDAHEEVARLIGASSWEEVVFTSNTTHAINLAAWTLALNGILGPGDEILVTEAEHHSNLLPWAAVAEWARARLRVLPVDGEGIPRWELLDDYLTERTRVVAFHLASNVTGARSPVEEVARAARSVGAVVVADGAQGVPHFPVDVRRDGVDMLAFSGHKMLGPTGIGVLWARRDLLEELEPPWRGGGQVAGVTLLEGRVEVSWDSPPWKFEAGTPPVVEAVGLAEAARYLRRIGMGEVWRHEAGLVDRAYKTLRSIEGLRLVGPPPGVHPRTGVVSFTVEGLTPDAVGLYLGARGIAVRAGLHCAHPLHRALGLGEGTVRASIYIYNCWEDLEALADALEAVARHARRARAR